MANTVVLPGDNIHSYYRITVTKSCCALGFFRLCFFLDTPVEIFLERKIATKPQNTECCHLVLKNGTNFYLAERRNEIILEINFSTKLFTSSTCIPQEFHLIFSHQRKLRLRKNSALQYHINQAICSESLGSEHTPYNFF